MRLALSPADWRQARLEDDDEARSWCDSLSRHGDRHTILRLEMLSEGVLAVHELLAGRRRAVILYTSGPHDRDFLYVRRRHRGPVPPQVLAAFRAEP